MKSTRLLHLWDSLKQQIKHLASRGLWIWICLPGFAPQDLALRSSPECALHWRGNPGQPGHCWTRTELTRSDALPFPLCPEPRNWPGAQMRLRWRAKTLTQVEQMVRGQSTQVREFWLRILVRTPASGPQRVTEDMTRALGFVHIWSASGIHLWALALSVSSFVSSVLRRHSLHSARWGRLAALLICGWAWVLADCSAGMLRPLLVIVLRSWSGFLGIQWRMWSPLALSLGIEAAVSATGASGRWHYAAAVGFGLIGLESARALGPSRFGELRAHAAMAVASWLPIALFEAFTQRWTAVLTPLWSLITVPLFAQVAYPLAFFGSAFAPAGTLGWFFGGVHQVFQWCVETSFWLPSIWHMSRLGALGGVALGCVNFALKGALSKRARVWLFVFACMVAVTRIALHASARITPAIAARDVKQLAVGQGDAALIQWDAQRSVLIDAGPPGGLLLSQFLSAWNPGAPSRLQTLALTHLDLDHRGGTSALSRWIDWECLLSPQTFDSTLPGGGCSLPGFWAVTHPETQHTRDRNQEMLGGWIPLPGAEYLNLGDADMRGEEKLWAKLAPKILSYNQGLSSGQTVRRILKASHHGSKTSSGRVLIQSYRPQTAWISAGRRNSFGHPHPKVLQRLKDAQIAVLSTQENHTLAISD